MNILVRKEYKTKLVKRVLIASSLTGIFNHFLNMFCLSISENIHIIYFTSIWEKKSPNEVHLFLTNTSKVKSGVCTYRKSLLILTVLG